MAAIGVVIGFVLAVALVGGPQAGVTIIGFLIAFPVGVILGRAIRRRL